MESKKWGPKIFGFIVIAGLGLFFILWLTGGTEPGATNTSDNSPAHELGVDEGENVVFAPDQRPDGRIVAPLVVLAQNGFVVVHAEENGSAGAILGASESLEKGDHYNVVVPLSRQSVAGEMLQAMIHADNGDGVFDPVADEPVQQNNEIITMRFMVDAEAVALPVDR